VGRFGGDYASIIQALQSRPGGFFPQAQPDMLPQPQMTDEMPAAQVGMPPAQPRGRQDLSGAQNGTIMGRNGGVQQLGAAATRRMAAPGAGATYGPPALPGPSGGIYANIDAGNPNGGGITSFDPATGVPAGPRLDDQPGGGDPRIAEIIDRVRMNPMEMPQLQTGRMMPPGVTGRPADVRPGAGARPRNPTPGGDAMMGGAGVASRNDGSKPRPGAVLGPPQQGEPVAKQPMNPGITARPGADFGPVQAGPEEKPVSPQGPAFDDMLSRLRSRGLSMASATRATQPR
jgi:hypothetical protein